MHKNIAINGCGRIGRTVLRTYFERYAQCKGDMPFKVTSLNDVACFDMLVHLLRYDSVHGPFQGTIERCDHTLKVTYGEHEHTLTLTQEAQLSRLPWKTHNIDTVFECSGVFNDGEKAAEHLKAGAKRVLISAPASRVDATVVYGVNHTHVKDHHRIISNASCTTNCLAPVAFVLDKAFGIEQGYMTTIHAYTADQCLVDGPHKDYYRARAAALSLIPTTTGAAKSLGVILPHLNGKLDGTAIRTPTANVSMIDLTFVSAKNMSKDTVNDAIKAALASLNGALQYNDTPLVSVDFCGQPYSAIFDGTQTQVIGERFGRVVAWYDNEVGFSHRMLDVGAYLCSL